MADSDSYSRLVPGFEFMQNLVKTAGAALPGIGQWVAPTLDPQELDKRIEELRTVQFWLEQNARMLGATIQALEVQRMTLSTLRTMNVQMDDLRESMTLRMPGADGKPGSHDAAPVAEPAAPTAEGTSRRQGAAAATAANADAQAGAAGGVDPMQWWGALTKQFAQLAASAMKEGVTAASPGMAQAWEPARSPSTEAAGDSRPASGGGSAGPAQSRKAATPASRPSRKSAPKKRSSSGG